MTDRITGYGKASIEDRIDEIAMRGADVHFEMMDQSGAYLSLIKAGMEHRFWFRAEKSRLILSMTENVKITPGAPAP